MLHLRAASKVQLYVVSGQIRTFYIPAAAGDAAVHGCRRFCPIILATTMRAWPFACAFAGVAANDISAFSSRAKLLDF